jgi:spermidine/putrescine transport system substrate-binding protein
MRRWMLAAAIAALLVAAGCGTDEPPVKGDEASAPVVPKGPVKGDLTIAQWPLYIDPGKRGTVAEFEKATGVNVEYVEEINDNAEFFGKLRPLLERGDSGDRS